MCLSNITPHLARYLEWVAICIRWLVMQTSLSYYVFFFWHAHIIIQIASIMQNKTTFYRGTSTTKALFSMGQIMEHFGFVRHYLLCSSTIHIFMPSWGFIVIWARVFLIQILICSQLIIQILTGHCLTRAFAYNGRNLKLVLIWQFLDGGNCSSVAYRLPTP